MSASVDLMLVVAVAVTSLVMALFVLRQARGREYIPSFFMMCVLFIFWAMSNYVANHYLEDVLITQIAANVAYVFGYGIFVSGLIFTLSFPVKRSIGLCGGLLIATIAIATIALSCTNLVAGDITLVDGALRYSNGSFLWLYLLSCLMTVGWAIYNLASTARQASGRVRRQAMILLAVFVSTALAGILLSIMLPLAGYGWHMTRLAPVNPLILIITMAYLIARHGLFDIRATAIRSIAYMLSLGTLALIYFSLAYVVSAIFFRGASGAGVSVSFTNIFLALFLAFIFQPVKRFFDKVTDRIFFRDRYDIDEFIANIGEVSTSTTNLNTLLKRSAEVVHATLKSSYVIFYVYREEGRYMSVGSSGAPRVLAGEFAVIDSAMSNKDMLLINQSNHLGLKKIADRHDLAMIVQLGKVGYLLLGEQKGYGYKTRDVKALQAIKNELVIAIQNVRSVQKVRDLNKHLQQRIEDATQELRASNRRLRQLDEVKDEFMSIASHQLRTPLTTVKGYLSMLIEGDLGRVTARQKKVLYEAFESSERMAGLINDFLNVSRLQTGKFTINRTKTHIAELVKAEVNGLRRSAKARELSLELHLPKEPVAELYLDETKIRQVIMNLVDNAIYYSRKGSVIDVRVEQRYGQVEVTVTDTGIGVPAKERDQLFTKFFRATNAYRRRPDGTGVGLFLAKKVIDGHGGTMIFQSKENKGSTFGFRLSVTAMSKPPVS